MKRIDLTCGLLFSYFNRNFRKNVDGEKVTMVQSCTLFKLNYNSALVMMTIRLVNEMKMLKWVLSNETINECKKLIINNVLYGFPTDSGRWSSVQDAPKKKTHDIAVVNGNQRGHAADFSMTTLKFYYAIAMLVSCRQKRHDLSFTRAEVASYQWIYPFWVLCILIRVNW